MGRGRHGAEHGLERYQAVLLCHDHDTARLAKLIEDGGRVVGWVDGFYKVQTGAKDGR